MKSDLKNIILAFGFVLLAASGGAGVYRFKNHYEYLLAAQYEAFQQGKNQEITELEASFASELSVQQAFIDSQKAALEELRAENVALAKAAGIVATQKQVAATAAQQAAAQALAVQQAQAQALAAQQAAAAAQALAQAAAQAQTPAKPPVVKPSRKSNAS